MNRIVAPDDPTKGLRREVQEMHEALADLAKRLDTLQRQTEQLVALRAAEQGAAARLDRLEPVLDMDRVSAHVREAVSRSDPVHDPVPHALISEVLPAAVYQAAIDAIPQRIFFERRGGWQVLPLPPALAAVDSIATWSFLSDVVKAALAPALMERFGRPVDRLAISRRWLVLRQPGDADQPARSDASEVLTIVLPLARPGDGEDYGSVLHTASAACAIPFRANTAVAILGSPAAHEYAPIPQSVPAETLRYACELRFTI